MGQVGDGHPAVGMLLVTENMDPVLGNGKTDAAVVRIVEEPDFPGAGAADAVVGDAVTDVISVEGCGYPDKSVFAGAQTQPVDDRVFDVGLDKQGWHAV